MKLNNFEEDKIWNADKETRRRESFGSQLPTIQEGIENDFGTVIFRDFGNGGGESTLPEQQDTSNDEKLLWNVELGGGEAIIIDDFEEVVGEERLELREEQVQWVGNQGMN